MIQWVTLVAILITLACLAVLLLREVRDHRAIRHGLLGTGPRKR